MANIVYDTLTISINADSKQANRSINSLSKNLRNLDETARDIDKERIEQVKGLLLDIANIDFSNVSKGLRDVVSAFNKLNKITGTQASNLMGNIDYQSLSPESQQNVDDTINKMHEVVDVQLQVAQSSKKAKKALDELGDSAKKSGKSADGLSDALKKLTKDFGRILKYRILRKVIQSVYKAFQEGLKATALADDKTNQSLSNLLSTFQYLTDSIGALVAPIVQILEPVLTALGDLLAELTDEWAQYFSAMAGNDYYLKATKQARDYRQELQKMQSIGIDELNVIQQDKGSQYEKAPIDQDIIDKTAEMRQNFERILTVVEDISRLLKDANLKALDPIIQLLSLVSSFVLDIYEIFKPIIEGITLVANSLLAKVISLIVQVYGYVEKILAKLEPVVVPIFTFIENILLTIGDTLGGILEAIGGAWTTIFEFFKTLFKTIVALFKGDTDAIGKLWDSLGEKLAETWKSVGAVFEELWNNIVERFSGFWDFLYTNVFAPIGQWFADTFTAIGQWFADVGREIKRVFEDIGDFFANIFNGIIDGFKQVGAFFEEVGTNVGSGIKDIWGKVVNGIIVALNAILGAIETFINWIIDGVAFLANLAGVDTSGWGVHFDRIPEYANGGFPEDGLFMANHGELVGQFAGGQTAVANNEQIIEGIKQGVMEAMQASGGGEIVINLDGYEIARAVTERQDNYGASVVKGGTLKYGG